MYARGEMRAHACVCILSRERPDVRCVYRAEKKTKPLYKKHVQKFLFFLSLSNSRSCISFFTVKYYSSRNIFQNDEYKKY